MSRLVINPYGVSESVNILKEAISEEGIRCLKLRREGSRFRGAQGDIIVNWGSSRDIPATVIGQATVLNKPSAVNTAANKTSALTTMREAGIRCVETTSSEDAARAWMESGDHVFARTQLRGHSGSGIVVCSTQVPEDLGNVEHSTTLVSSPLYTRGITQQHREYRVHVFKGQIIFLQQKRRRNNYRENENYSNVVRNHGNGWIYGHNQVTPPNNECLVQAVKATEALGLDFGAVDVLTHGNEAWVLEVNTAPGQSGETTRARYTEAFVKVFNGEEVEGVMSPSQAPESPVEVDVAPAITPEPEAIPEPPVRSQAPSRPAPQPVRAQAPQPASTQPATPTLTEGFYVIQYQDGTKDVAFYESSLNILMPSRHMGVVDVTDVTVISQVEV